MLANQNTEIPVEDRSNIVRKKKKLKNEESTD